MVNVPLTNAMVRTAALLAADCTLGGVSRVRAAEDRDATVADDNLIGQLGQLALSLYLYGSIERYLLSRYAQNKFPTQGDGGEDLLGMNVDVKTSLMRYSQDPTRYRLAVRPHERHAEWVYVLALVPEDWTQNPQVWLAGWAAESMLPAVPETDGPFAGAYTLANHELHPLMPLRHRLNPLASHVRAS